VFGRWGGEEFIALLPDTELEGAETAAERIRFIIENLVLEADDGAAIRTTVSIGVSVWLHDGDTLEALLMRGDAALYQAKGTGRNRVCIASPVSAGARPASRSLQPLA
jgi:diguanylate cyclase (GGDEF)-like protein